MAMDQDRLLGEAPAFLRILEEVSQVALLDKPVLIVGERGTGKELIAARLHFLSNRWEGQFLKMNCAAISDSLLESELFGHEAGAFTGATRTHHGRFERAHGGTLFLDELANTSVLVQEKLLRIIEYGDFERVGGSKTLNCDVRLIAATNDDLPRLAKAGKFRSDLLDRLAFDVLTLPPLRDREADIQLLADHFAINMATELGREYFPGFSNSARIALAEYPWPGNVRELKNVVERCVYRSNPDIEVEEIIFDPFDSPFRPLDPSRSDPSHTDAAMDHTLPLDLKKTVQTFEIDLINQAMQQGKHNQRKAAELLSLTYHQMRGYLKKYELLKSD
ncbi:MAG: phage shock protein operon transcriptional activator [Pseudomonadales bacterium]